MTLIVSINTPETIWMLADRRLSFQGRRPKDDARKIMFLETKDGVAILGYAGLGATAKGTEPVDWMSRVLRGRDVLLEQALSILAAAHRRQMPGHLLRFPKFWNAEHNLLVSAFLNDRPCLYSIDMQIALNRKFYNWRHTRYQAQNKDGTATVRAPRIGVAGSGAAYFKSNKSLGRELVRAVRACDEKKISHEAVAHYLASINMRVHSSATDGSVGPRCIIAWRNRKGGAHAGGGAQRGYSNGVLDRDHPPLPTIAGGTDINALIGAVTPYIFKSMPRLGTTEAASPLDVEAMNAALARLPWTPDENLS